MRSWWCRFLVWLGVREPPPRPGLIDWSRMPEAFHPGIFGDNVTKDYPEPWK